jgi:hypothetical protein
MDGAKDLTPTLFGYTIAYILPGLSGLFAVALFSDSVAAQLQSFGTAESSVGLFFLVVLSALLIGMHLHVVRWIVFECLFFRKTFIPNESFASLKEPHIAASFRTAIDENFRYHQFYGAQLFVIPPLMFGVARRLGVLWPSGMAYFFVALTAVSMIALFATAASGWKRYVERGQQVLKGG